MFLKVKYEKNRLWRHATSPQGSKSGVFPNQRGFHLRDEHLFKINNCLLNLSVLKKFWKDTSNMLKMWFWQLSNLGYYPKFLISSLIFDYYLYIFKQNNAHLYYESSSRLKQLKDNFFDHFHTPFLSLYDTQFWLRFNYYFYAIFLFTWFFKLIVFLNRNHMIKPWKGIYFFKQIDI